MTTYQDHGITIPAGAKGPEVAIQCPKCSHDRKKHNLKCLSVNIVKKTWNCKNCGWADGLRDNSISRPAKQYTKPKYRAPENVPGWREWLHKRGISDDVIARNAVFGTRTYFPQVSGDLDAIAFPYCRNGEIVNYKYRSLEDKYFRMESGCELVLYGLDDIDSETPLAWVEGECLTPDTEILTSDGWMHLDSYDGRKICQVSEGGQGEFVLPKAIVRKYFTGDLISFSNRGFSLVTTPDHQMIAERDGKWTKFPARSEFKDSRYSVPRSCVVNGPGIPLTDNQIILALAVSADAAIDIRFVNRTKSTGGKPPKEKRYVRFGLKRARKIKRLRDVCAVLGIIPSDNSIKDDYQSICFPLPDWVPGRLLPHGWIYQASAAQRRLILEELVHWDGNHVPNRSQTEYSTKLIHNAIFVQTLAHTLGICSTIMPRKNKFGSWFKVSILWGKSRSNWQCVRRQSIPYSGEVFCVQVPSGAILVRHNSRIMVTGNCDRLAMETAGFMHVVSVPNGAPAPNAKNYESLFTFLDSAEEVLSKVPTHIIAVDNDLPGQALEAELSRRLGTEKCLRVTWPEGCKDANDVLIKHGVDELKWRIKNADPFPIEGSFQVTDLTDEIFALYHNGVEPGKSTGWHDLDQYYTVRPGELTVVTGVPGSGKSNWVDNLAINLARWHDWRFGIFSPENLPLENHMSAMLEKYIRKPFHSWSNNRMDEIDLEKAMDWMSNHFSWIMPRDVEEWTLDKVLSTANTLCLRYGIRGLIIDPFNELESMRPDRQSETEYIGECAKKIRIFGRTRGVHVWVVAHPAKLYRDKSGKYPIPTMYDISGCHAAGTEVLTKDRGWLPHSEVTMFDMVACFDLGTKTMRYARPSKIWEFDYDGEMHHWHSPSYDALVTPNHRMVIRPSWRTKPSFANRAVMNGIGRPVAYAMDKAWNFVESRNVRSDMEMPWATPFENSAGDVESIYGLPADAVLKFLGDWIAEGWASGNAGIGLCQAVGGKAEAMQAALIHMGVKFTIRVDAPRRPQDKAFMWKAYVLKSPFTEWVRAQCGVGSQRKRIPDFVWGLSDRQKEILFMALMDGDGHWYEDGDYGKYATTSPALAGQVQRLAIELGRMASISSVVGAQNHHKRRYSVAIGSEDRHHITVRRGRNFTSTTYTGKVFCLTVPTGAYLIRRNGKVGIYGNSANWRNKADNGLCLWRDFSIDSHEVDIHIQKIRSRHVGKLGKTTLVYQGATATYADVDHRPEYQKRDNS